MRKDMLWDNWVAETVLADINSVDTPDPVPMLDTSNGTLTMTDEYPFGAAPVAWVTAVGVISYLLLRQDFPSGYVLTIFTGIFGLFSLGLILAGPHGPPPGEPASPALFVVFGPGAYIAVAVGLIISSSLAWRQRSKIREPDSLEQAEI